MKILIATCTKSDKTAYEQTAQFRTLVGGGDNDSTDSYSNYSNPDFDVTIKLNNRENIGKHYNKAIDMAIDEGYECLILMHDDVAIEDKFFVDKIKQGFEEADILGLAGGLDMKLKPPTLWHIMTTQNTWSGAVAHAIGDKDVLMTTFGPAPKRCLLLDGLFLAIKVNSLKDTPDLRFDENIPAIAHLYDLDFCLQANKHKLKLSTWPIWAVHASPGLEDVTDEFKMSQTYFLDKWRTNTGN